MAGTRTDYPGGLLGPPPPYDPTPGRRGYRLQWTHKGMTVAAAVLFATGIAEVEGAHEAHVLLFSLAVLSFLGSFTLRRRTDDTGQPPAVNGAPIAPEPAPPESISFQEYTRDRLADTQPALAPKVFIVAFFAQLLVWFVALLALPSNTGDSATPSLQRAEPALWIWLGMVCLLQVVAYAVYVRRVNAGEASRSRRMLVRLAMVSGFWGIGFAMVVLSAGGRSADMPWALFGGFLAGGLLLPLVLGLIAHIWTQDQAYENPPLFEPRPATASSEPAASWLPATTPAAVVTSRGVHPSPWFVTCPKCDMVWELSEEEARGETYVCEECSSEIVVADGSPALPDLEDSPEAGQGRVDPERFITCPGCGTTWQLDENEARRDAYVCEECSRTIPLRS